LLTLCRPKLASAPIVTPSRHPPPCAS
jgi:hypothetical protein